MNNGFKIALAAVLVGSLSVWTLGADKPRLPAGGGTPKQPAAEGKPKPAPVETPETADGRKTLGNAITFTIPKDWVPAKNAMSATRAAYVSPDHEAMMSIEVLPATMKIDASLAAGMMKKMKENRVANKQKYVQEPAVEKDDKFVIRIREKYEIKDKVADQLHLYRPVGSRFVLVTINSLAGEEKSKEYHRAGEEASLSATPSGK